MELKSNLIGRRWIKKSLLQSGALKLLGRLRPPTVLVLMYHSILDDPRKCADSIGMSNIHATALFREQMEIIARNYVPVTAEDIRLFLAGQKALPRRAVAVTFDDGYVDNAEIAAPVLDRLGIPASFYLTVQPVDTGRPPWFCYLRHAFATTKKGSWIDPSGRTWELGDERQREAAYYAACEDVTKLVGGGQQEALQALEGELDTQSLIVKERLMMTWDQAKKLCRDGHVVGSHSLTHPNMAHIEEEDLNFELAESKTKMEVALGMPVVHFSYPAAALAVSWTEHTVAATKQAGYGTAATTTHGLVTQTDNPLSLRRIGAPLDFDQFQWILQYASSGLSRA